MDNLRPVGTKTVLLDAISGFAGVFLGFFPFPSKPALRIIKAAFFSGRIPLLPFRLAAG